MDEIEKNAEHPLKETKDDDKSDKIFTLIQISVAIIIILFFLLLKSIGGEVYNKTKEWYVNNINNVFIIQSSGENTDRNV